MSLISMKERRKPRARGHLSLLFLALALGGVSSSACTPRVVRSTEPSQPVSAIGLVEDAETLDALSRAFSPDPALVRRARDQALRLRDVLEARASEAPLEQMALKRAELSASLWERLLPLAEQNVSTRRERAEVSAAMAELFNDYLEELAALEASFDVSSSPVGGALALEDDIEAETLPPPDPERLFHAYRNGEFAQVVREIEALDPEVRATMESASAAAYALSLGALGRYDEALAVEVDQKEIGVEWPEAFRLPYVRALWTMEAGKTEEGRAALQALDVELGPKVRELERLKASVHAASYQTSWGSERFVREVAAIRLLMEEGRFEDARARCTRLMEAGTTVEFIERIDALLDEIDVLESGRDAVGKGLRQEAVSAEGGSLEGRDGAEKGTPAEAEPVPEPLASGGDEAPVRSGARMEPAGGAGAQGVDGGGAADVTVSGAAAEGTVKAGSPENGGKGGLGAGDALSADEQAVLEKGRALMKAREYPRAIALFESLEGSAVEGEANALREKAVDLHIQAVREWVAREYVRARQLRSDQEKLKLFAHLYNSLSTALETYPDTHLRSRAEHSLKVIEDEIRRLDPDWFQTHASFRGRTETNAEAEK